MKFLKYWAITFLALIAIACSLGGALWVIINGLDAAYSYSDTLGHIALFTLISLVISALFAAASISEDY